MNHNNGPRCKDTHAARDKNGDDRAAQWAPKHSKPDKGPRTKDLVIRPRKCRPASTWCQSLLFTAKTK